MLNDVNITYVFQNKRMINIFRLCKTNFFEILCNSSDTEEEKNYKAWKKSIMLVWRAAATHK